MQSHIALAIVISALFPLGFVPYLIAQTETSTSISGGFANVQTFQDDEHIVITVTKSGAEIPEEPGAPVVIDPGDNGSGVVVVPVENVTEPAPSEDVVIIEPNGNVTELPGNVTNIDNSTVIVAPENQTVTETPADVIVIDPPACDCPTADDEPVAEESEPIPPVTNDTGGIITIEPEEPVSSTNETTESTNDTAGTDASFLGWLQGLVEPQQ